MSIFFDTNVFVYLFDASAPEKKAIARRIFQKEVESNQLTLSTQVLQELYVVITRKLDIPLSATDAKKVIEDLAQFTVIQVIPQTILSAIEIHQEYGLSFWDSLIVQAAIDGGASSLYSEDMQHAQQIRGVTIFNPFL